MSVALNVAEIRSAIVEACARSGREEQDVHLLAVSKMQPFSAIEEAYACGIRDFGENYVQELALKRDKLAHLKDIRWHLIGHLQANKAKQAVRFADYFHALDSEKLLLEISKRLRESGASIAWPVFIEVNIDQEESKSGVLPEQLDRLALAAGQAPEIRLQGLMCVPAAKVESRDNTRSSFRALKHLALELESRGLVSRPLQLSMGMSEDFMIAIEEGADWIRLGRKLFGERAQKR